MNFYLRKYLFVIEILIFNITIKNIQTNKINKVFNQILTQIFHIGFQVLKMI